MGETRNSRLSVCQLAQPSRIQWSLERGGLLACAMSWVKLLISA